MTRRKEVRLGLNITNLEGMGIDLSDGSQLIPSLPAPDCGWQTHLDFVRVDPVRQEETGCQWQIILLTSYSGSEKNEVFTVNVPSATSRPKITSYQHLGADGQPSFPRAKIKIRLGKVVICIQLVARQKDVKIVECNP